MILEIQVYAGVSPDVLWNHGNARHLRGFPTPRFINLLLNGFILWVKTLNMNWR